MVADLSTTGKFDFYMLDVHVANKCNLHCDGCNHWSNYSFSEVFSTEELADWARPWASRISPSRINLLGGEPFLNKECPAILKAYRDFFPEADLKLFTNGFFLSKQPWLYDHLVETGAGLIITFHSRDPRYLKRLNAELAFLQSWGELELVKDTWFRKVYRIRGVKVEIRDMRGHWYKNYRGNGINARPHQDNNPRASWEQCVSKHSVQLYHGKLHKCGAITYLNDFLSKYELMEHPDWEPYTHYQGLAPDCTDEELREFLLREEEQICGMCPSNPTKIEDKEVFAVKKA